VVLALTSVTSGFQWQASGCTARSQTQQCAHGSVAAAVRCCAHQQSNTTCVSVCDMDQSPHQHSAPLLDGLDGLKASHTEAAAECAARGMRLCTRAELALKCCKTGCRMDQQWVWTADECPAAACDESSQRCKPHSQPPGRRRPRFIRPPGSTLPCLFGSQKGQDNWVKRNSIHLRTSARYFVDLAANEPECLSNSVLLERELGWAGLCIEANPSVATRLRAHRACTVVEAPVASSTRLVAFQTAGALGGIVGEGMLNEGRNTQTLSLKTRRLDEMLREAKAPRRIGYLSLDVEGAEDDAICFDFPFGEYTFLLMTIERPPPSLNERLFKNGYLFVLNHHYDSFYVHSTHPDAAAIARNHTFQQVMAPCIPSRAKGKYKGKALHGDCPWS